MAIKVRSGNNTDTIKVISKIDDAIDTSAENFEDTYIEYLKEMDESKLTIVPGKIPTRFVLKRFLKYDEQYEVKSKQYTIDKKHKETQINMAFVYDEIRVRLVGIENDPAETDCLVYKADGSGGATKDLMSKIVDSGVVDDLYLAVHYDNERRSGAISKKNS
jgi:hypothetical protein